MPDDDNSANTRPTAMAPDASTSPVDWGPEIRVDGKRPAFVQDDDRLDWRYADNEPMTGVGEPKCFGWQLSWDGGSVRTSRFHVSHIRLPADHPHYRQPTTPERDPALWDRMEALLRRMVNETPQHLEGAWVREARAIVADLPKPVDPDLLLARQCVIETLKPEDHRRCNCRDKIAAGEWDDGHKVRIARAAIAKARGTTPAPEVSHVG